MVCDVVQPQKEQTLHERLIVFSWLMLISFIPKPALGQIAIGPIADANVGVSSTGSEGMPDTDSVYQAVVAKGAKQGKRSMPYMQSLIALGMHYNRVNRFADASKALKQALQIIDAGALKPAPNAERKPERIAEKHESNDVVSAQIVRTSYPYEETLQELLPQLVTAELGTNELDLAESNLKRLLKIKGANPVADKLSLMSVYSSYAEIMRRRHLPKDAAMYQKKVDEINASFKPL